MGLDELVDVYDLSPRGHLGFEGQLYLLVILSATPRRSAPCEACGARLSPQDERRSLPARITLGLVIAMLQYSDFHARGLIVGQRLPEDGLRC